MLLRAYNHPDFICLLPKLGQKKVTGSLWYSEFALDLLGSWSALFIPRLQHTIAFLIKCVMSVVLPLLFLLLFRHSAKSLNAQEERLATSP